MRTLNRKSGGGNGNYIGFKVEARLEEIEGLSSDPVLLADGKTLLGHEWKEIHFDEGRIPYGVPGRSSIEPNFGHQLLPYKSALALAHTVIAQNSHKNVECQIIQHRVSYAYSVERKGYVDNLQISDKACFMPKIVDDVPAAPVPEFTDEKPVVVVEDIESEIDIRIIEDIPTLQEEPTDEEEPLKATGVGSHSPELGQ
jgi:hypothetical protein